MKKKSTTPELKSRRITKSGSALDFRGSVKTKTPQVEIPRRKEKSKKVLQVKNPKRKQN
jgi:hypothetical protein